MKGSRTKYRRFATAAEAIRYAVEDLRTPRAVGAWLQGWRRAVQSVEIQRLYEDGEYPLRILNDRMERARCSLTGLNEAPFPVKKALKGQGLR